MNAQAPASIASDSTANLEAEQALLGAILCRNEAMSTIACNLQADHFSQPVHSRIFEVAVAMIGQGRSVSPITIKDYFTADATLNEIGGMAYLAHLAAAATTIVNVPAYAQIVRDLAARRQAIARCEDAVIDLRTLTVDSGAEEYCSALAHDLSAIGEGCGGRARSTFSADAVVNTAIDDAASAYQNKGRRMDGIPSGIGALDAKIGGLCQGDLIIVGGRPGMGKTSLAIQLLYNVAAAGIPSLLVSLEMRTAQLGHRLLAMKSGVEYSRIAWGKFSEREFGQIVEAGKDVAATPLMIDDRSSMNIAQLSASVARAKARQPKLGVVFLDYLSLVDAGDRYAGRKVDEIGQISAGCKRIAKQYNVCFVALQQLSRGLESRENKRPTLSDLRDSGAIEQDADCVIFPWREAYYVARDLEAETEQSTERMNLEDRLAKINRAMQIIVAKNRQGSVGSVEVYCDIAHNIIRDTDTQLSLAGEPF